VFVAKYIIASNSEDQSEVYNRIISHRSTLMTSLLRTNENQYDPAREMRKEHTAEWMIAKMNVTLDSIQWADEEGLVDRDILFSGGRGGHEEVKAEMGRFYRERRERWEGEEVKGLGEVERRKALKVYLRDESRDWREDLRGFRTQLDHDYEVKS
jgi:hypothetical protein